MSKLQWNDWSVQTSVNDELEIGITTTATVIGVILLFVPYAFIFVPGVREPVFTALSNLYFHTTPRTGWNASVDTYPPRKIAGYICALITCGLPCFLIQQNNYSKPSDFWFYFGQTFIYISLPILMAIIRPPAHSPCDIGDLLILIFILLPLELSEYVTHFLPNITLNLVDTWPDISMLEITGLNIGIIIYFIFRPLKDIGLGWDIGRYSKIHWVLIRLIIAAALFCIVAVPVGLSLNYIGKAHFYKSATKLWRDGIAQYFVYFILSSLPYEFLFRGVVQNLLHSFADSRAEARNYLQGASIDYSVNDAEKQKKISGVKYSRDIALEIDMKDNSLDKKPLTKVSDPFSDVTPATHHYYGTNESFTTPLVGDIQQISKSFLPEPRDTCSHGIFWWFALRHWRDWTCLVLAAIFYGITAVHWDHGNATDLVAGFFLVVWLGCCCGWLWRHTNSVFISAVLQSLILYIARSVFEKGDTLCNGAC